MVQEGIAEVSSLARPETAPNLQAGSQQCRFGWITSGMSALTIWRFFCAPLTKQDGTGLCAGLTSVPRRASSACGQCSPTSCASTHLRDERRGPSMSSRA